MTRLRLALALAAALLAARPGGAIADSPIFPDNGRVSVKSEPTGASDVAELEVSATIKGAAIYLDKLDAVKLPYAATLLPGSYYLELVADGYYDLGVWLMLEKGKAYTVVFRPARIVGFLSLDIEPRDARIEVDGAVADQAQGPLELPVGRHEVAIYRFGYVERKLAAEIEARKTTVLSLQLDVAPFAISGFGFGRSTFNPRNAGAAGKNPLDFRVTSFGSATAEIRGPGGELVAALDYPDIRSWSQSRTWDGRGPDGMSLPDGLYTATLVASPGPGVEGEGSLTASAETRIDSSIVVRAFGSASALPGLLHMPDTLIQPAGTRVAECSWFEPWGEPQASGFGLSAALSIAGAVELALHAAAEAGGGGQAPGSAADLAASALVGLFGDRSSLGSGALFLRGGYSSASSPAVPGARTGIEASLPLSLRAGELSLSFSPGCLLDLSASSPAFLGLARGGLMIEGPAFRAGASVELPLSFEGLSSASPLPSPAWPAEAALEGRLMLGSTPFVAAAYLDAALEPGQAPRLGIGVGLGLLF
jgi:hypothetical protein